MCEYCENGLPTRVAAIIDPLKEKFPRSMNGPAHIVVSDLNLDDDNIRWSLALLDNPGELAVYRDNDYSEEELQATRAALEALLTIPESERDPTPHFT